MKLPIRSNTPSPMRSSQLLLFNQGTSSYHFFIHSRTNGIFKTIVYDGSRSKISTLRIHGFLIHDPTDSLA
ncbi:hypothetical protein Q5O89_08360 [Peribacillus frigoritolerans]|nr:hypothetical protein [Peribacillus frigoritolerans]